MKKTTGLRLLMALLFAMTFVACAQKEDQPDQGQNVQEVMDKIEGKWLLDDFDLLNGMQVETEALKGFFLDFRPDKTATVIVPPELMTFFKVEDWSYSIEAKGKALNVVFDAEAGGKSYRLPVAVSFLEEDTKMKLSALGFSITLKRS